MPSHLIIRPVRRGPSRRSARVAARAAVAAALLVLTPVLSGCAGDRTPSPVGDPDPGDRLTKALQPVLTAVPSGATVTLRRTVDRQWDSCDGDPATFGWDPPSVQVQFTGAGSVTQVVAQVGASLRALGWTADGAGADPGPWQGQWHRTLPGGHQAEAQLSGDADGSGAGWILQASTAPVTHPVQGC
ncbi:hypothetical protein [Streptacidiphilus melanogenes]|uniref:hypothetical protein n=1 Tax=Streptacidiphilus melanogenes TaxID=411235 RepID=UPI0005A65B92|nr:hypothetical protein [Streptacidiphilus melanogenes]